MKDRERAIGALTMLIDSDQPPGLAAAELARTVVALVESREPRQAIEISTALMKLGKRFPRRRKALWL